MIKGNFSCPRSNFRISLVHFRTFMGHESVLIQLWRQHTYSSVVSVLETTYPQYCTCLFPDYTTTTANNNNELIILKFCNLCCCAGVHHWWKMCPLALLSGPLWIPAYRWEDVSEYTFQANCSTNVLITSLNSGHSIIFHQYFLQTALTEASLPGFKKESVSRSEIQENKATNYSNQNVTLQVQQWVVFIINSKISINWIDCCPATIIAMSFHFLQVSFPQRWSIEFEWPRVSDADSETSCSAAWHG